MFQWQSARRTSGEKEGTWQEKVPSSVEEDTGDCISSAHTLTSHSHTLSVVCAHGSLAQPTPTLTPPTPTLTPPTPTLTPPTHVHVHSQYTVGGPVLVQLVPTSHFGLRVEQEVVKKPEDNQWTTATHTANNSFIHINCTIQHICTNKILCSLACLSH